MRKAYFATSKIPFVNNKDDEEVKAGKKPAGLVNYYTEKVALSAALFERSTVKDLTLYWRPYDTATQEPATSDASLTIDGADLRTFAAVANQAALDAVTFDNAVALPSGKGNLFDNVAFNGDVLEAKDADGEVVMYRQADGDVVFTAALWNHEYYRNLEMHLRDFAAQTTR